MRVLRMFVLAALTAAALASVTRPVAAAARRNIVVIMIDDADVETIQMMVAKGMMPYFKYYFADAGYSFVQAYSTGAWGGPSRATFLTGRYPHNHGELGNDPLLGGAPRFNQSSTIATWLKTAGYRTSIVGRYVPGYGIFTAPTFIPPGWDNWLVLTDPGTWSPINYSMNLNGAVVDFGELADLNQIEIYQTDLVSYFAGQVIRDAVARPEPFFLHVTPVIFNREIYPSPTRFNMCPDPADPFSGGHPLGAAQRPPLRYMDTIYGNATDFPLPAPPNFNEADVSDKPNWLAANSLLQPQDVDCLQKRYWRRLEALRAVDDLVGNVLWVLQSTGVLNNTIVVFTADNGWSDGQHRFADKSTPYEESVRVPLYIRPAAAVTPRAITRMVLNTDLAPTIAELAGASPTHTVDGRSLVPLLQNPDLLPWRKLGYFRNVVGSTFVASYPQDYHAVRSDAPAPRKYVRYPTVASGPTGELYDLTADPYELENRFDDPARAAERTRLQQFLDAMKTCRGITCLIFEQYFTF